MTRYTSWDYNVVNALQKFWFWYLLDKTEGITVTSLNRIKGFVEDFLGIRNPTKRLIHWILEETAAWTYIWEWIDTSLNVCQLFIVNINKFTTWVKKLLDTWVIRKEKVE